MCFGSGRPRISVLSHPRQTAGLYRTSDCGAEPYRLNQHRVIDIAGEGRVHGVEIDVVPVRRELDAVCQPIRQIFHESDGRFRSSRSYEPARDKLCVRVDGDPGPNIAVTKLPLKLRGHVLRLRVHEAPNLVALDALTGEIAQMLALLL